MACPNKYQKSSLRAYNQSEQNFSTSGNIVFSNIAYTSGTSISCAANSDTIYLKTNGLYYITIDVVMANGTANTDTIVQMYANGALVPAALVETTLTTTTDFQDGTISAVIPVDGCNCPCMSKAITFKVSGTTALIEGVNVNVIRLA